MVDLPSYVLDILFDSFGEEIISDDDDIRNYDDVGKLGNDSRSTFYRYSDASDEESYRMKPEEEQHTVVVGTRWQHCTPPINYPLHASLHTNNSHLYINH